MHSTNNDANNNWVLNGIQYAIFKRISPSLTHDMVSPLSVALIQAGILKRKLKNDSVNPHDLLENAVNLESHIKQTVLLIRAMKSWDSPNDQIFSASTIYTQGIKFFRTRFSIRGIELALIENHQSYAEITDFHAFMYSWLGLLCYLEDRFETPVKVSVEHIADKTISILFEEKSTTEDLPPLINPSEDCIGEQELLLLSARYATTFEFNQDSILFKW